MCDGFSSIWVEFGSKEKFLIAGIYRDHQWMKQPTRISLSKPNQLARWNIFTEQWSKALDSGIETHAIGDFNLNFNQMNQPGSEDEEFDRITQDRIISRGSTQCVSGVTRMCQITSE